MMMARRHHTAQDVESKLHQADEMAAQGRTQKEISTALGISIMTYHRWRKSREQQPVATPAFSPAPRPSAMSELERMSKLEIENARLRRLVTDLLLEKMALQEELEDRERKRREE
ncbi:helix-turn-helix domain-containing protein [Xanthobacteraceae bacterium Astr-EGSB]|uniref:helix-turn-helix domain-containing protein n=1 Tax=Astrobacterium formosum TaxID=3069710 RepID=UPI0027B7F3D8|nr:helix-turn-helix domain-containing protein [Xanthobacteraceae bacterium Astr-EGSB]